MHALSILISNLGIFIIHCVHHLFMLISTLQIKIITMMIIRQDVDLCIYCKVKFCHGVLLAFITLFKTVYDFHKLCLIHIDKTCIHVCLTEKSSTCITLTLIFTYRHLLNVFISNKITSLIRKLPFKQQYGWQLSRESIILI